MKAPGGHPYFKFFRSSETWHLQLWRYIDLPKFLSLLQTQALHFARCDKLDDPYEGRDSIRNIRELKELASSDLSLKLGPYDPVEAQDLERKTTYVSCWHMNEVESAAMWSLYSSEAMIAIRTTYDRLTRCGVGRLVDRVKYVDFETEDPVYANALSPFFHKRKSFEYEQEVRAIRHNVTDGGLGENGLLVDVELDVLIDTIYVSPTTPPWFREAVQNVAQKYGLNRTVVRSSLLDGPVY